MDDLEINISPSGRNTFAQSRAKMEINRETEVVEQFLKKHLTVY